MKISASAMSHAKGETGNGSRSSVRIAHATHLDLDGERMRVWGSHEPGARINASLRIPTLIGH